MFPSLSRRWQPGFDLQSLRTRACLDWLRSSYPALPFLIGGFSFGARIAQKLGCPAQGPELVIAVGFPTSYLSSDSFEQCAGTRVFIQSTNDQYGPRDQLQPFVDKLGDRARAIWVDAEDHFFAGGLDELESAVVQAGRLSK